MAVAGASGGLAEINRAGIGPPIPQEGGTLARRGGARLVAGGHEHLAEGVANPSGFVVSAVAQGPVSSRNSRCAFVMPDHPAMRKRH
jgi:hypothetical protein